jgi:hypothetical protein
MKWDVCNGHFECMPKLQVQANAMLLFLSLQMSYCLSLCVYILLFLDHIGIQILLVQCGERKTWMFQWANNNHFVITVWEFGGKQNIVPIMCYTITPLFPTKIDFKSTLADGVYFLAYLPESATSFDESHPSFLAICDDHTELIFSEQVWYLKVKFEFDLYLVTKIVAATIAWWRPDLESKTAKYLFTVSHYKRVSFLREGPPSTILVRSRHGHIQAFHHPGDVRL